MNDFADEMPELATIDVSIVIPVYGSEASIESLVDRVVEVLRGSGRTFEIVCVNDDSPDGSWAALQRTRERHPAEVVAVRLMRNFGQHNATMCGIKLARGGLIVTMDDDLQHRPEDLPRLIERLESAELDVVYGTYQEKRHSLFRNFGSWLINQVYRRIFKIPFNFSSYRAFRRPIAIAISRYGLNFTFIDGLLAWTTSRIGNVTVQHQPREAGRSGYRLGKLIVLALNLVTNFSLAPLQVATLLGLVAAFGGLTLGAAFLVIYFLGDIEVPGFASTIIAVLVLGGVQLLALGAIGEYVGRLHINFNRKPQYVVREVSKPTQARVSTDIAAERGERPTPLA